MIVRELDPDNISHRDYGWKLAPKRFDKLNNDIRDSPSAAYISYVSSSHNPKLAGEGKLQRYQRKAAKLTQGLLFKLWPE